MTATGVYHKSPRGRQVVDVSAAFTAVAFFVVSLRLYTRFMLIRQSGWEDSFIILAIICSVGLTICMAFQAKWGLGQHIADITKEDMQKALKAFYASILVYYLNLGLTKASILLQYKRIFDTRIFRRVCWCLLVLNAVFTIWSLLGMAFICNPVRAFWTKESAKCIDQNIMWFTNSAVHLLGDIIIVILPIPLIHRLNLAKRQKRALEVIFALGGLVCLISIIRFHSLVEIANSTDPTYKNPPAAMWSAIEINIGLICACLPLLRPLVTKWFPNLLHTPNGEAHTTPHQHPITIGRATCRPNLSALHDFDHNGTNSATELTENSMKSIHVTTSVHVAVEGEEARMSKSYESLTSSLEGARNGSSSAESSVKEARDIV